MKKLNVKLVANLFLAVMLSAVPVMTAQALTISGNNVGMGIDTPLFPLDVVGNVNATSFTGNGAGLTGIDGTNITGGTVGATALGAGAVSSGKIAVNAVSPVNIDFLGNVAIVAPSGGNYNNPATAMSESEYTKWCAAPSETTPCLLKIMPGVYAVGASTVQMRSYIDIEGSGENTTIIQGSIDGSSSGVVNGASNAELRLLTVKNTGGAVYALAVTNRSASPKMTNITVVTSGSFQSYGVFNVSSSPIMTNVTVTASGGSNSNVGVYNLASSPTITNVTITASGGVGSYGVDNNDSSSPIMTNVTAVASGGSGINAGVSNSAGSSPVMTNVTSTASGSSQSYGVINTNSSPVMSNVTATGNYGIYCDSSGMIKINHSVIKGATNTIYNGSGVTTLVGNTQLDGGAVSGTLTCVGAYDTNYVTLGTNCLPLP